jgi:hypothetical protein
MGSETGFDVGDRHARGECSKGGAKCARRVALHDKEIRRLGEVRQDRQSDGAHVIVRIFPAGAGKVDGWKAIEAELARVQPLMLTGKNQARRYAARFERSGNGPQLDCFRSGANDQPDVGETQPSP